MGNRGDVRRVALPRDFRDANPRARQQRARLGASTSKRAWPSIVLTIREENAAQKALDAALERWDRARDAWEAITWVLARDPEVGEPVTESGTVRAYTIEGARSIGLPTITLLYEISIFQLIVHDARF